MLVQDMKYECIAITLIHPTRTAIATAHNVINAFCMRMQAEDNKKLYVMIVNFAQLLRIDFRCHSKEVKYSQTIANVSDVA